MILHRPGFCFVCRKERIFSGQYAWDWRCLVCKIARTKPPDYGHWSYGESDFKRFWDNVNLTPYCWNWARPSKSKLGPRFQMKDRSIKIARMAYFFFRGAWPKGGAFRSCTNKICVRPDHLLDLKQADISRTMIRQGRLKTLRKPRQEKCKRGHAASNWRTASSGNRFCRRCCNLGHRAWYRKKRLLAAPI